MHAAYDADNQAALLGAVHKGNEDLPTLLHIPATIYLQKEATRDGDTGAERGSRSTAEQMRQDGHKGNLYPHGGVWVGEKWKKGART